MNLRELLWMAWTSSRMETLDWRSNKNSCKSETREDANSEDVNKTLVTGHRLQTERGVMKYVLYQDAKNFSCKWNLLGDILFPQKKFNWHLMEATDLMHFFYCSI